MSAVPSAFEQTISISGNTAGTASYAGSDLVYQGGNGITLSLTSNSLILSVVPGGGGGVVSLNGSAGQLTMVAGNNFSVSNNANTMSLINVLSSSASAAAVASVSNAGAQASLFALVDHAHAGVGGVGASNTGNTSGNTGTSAGTWVLAGGNNITISQSTGAGGVHTLWIIGV